MKLLFLALYHLCTSHLQGAIFASAETEDGGSPHLNRRVDDHYEKLDVTVAYTSQEKTILRISAISASCLSVFVTIIALYWLLRMKQVFRHRYSRAQIILYIHAELTITYRLISLIIFGDFIKALFHLIIASAAMMGDSLGSESNICQISGFFVHFGAEISGW